MVRLTFNSDGYEVNGITYRNLEAQVLKNKEDIAKHKTIETLLGFGIKVIGRVDSPDLLPPKETFNGEYGDTYAVGLNEPFDYWIWTREDPNAGELTPYWLNIGSIAIQGPQGAEGPKGEKGDTGRSTKWITRSAKPADDVGEDGDYALINSNTELGNVYEKRNGEWILIGNIKGPIGIQGPQGIQGIEGPQGPQGIEGPPGVSGQTVDIVGIIDSIDQLPTPSASNKNYAYLVGQDHYIYIVTGTGTTEDPYLWENVGAFNAGTVVVDKYNNPIDILNIDQYLKVPTSGIPQYKYALTIYDSTNSMARELRAVSTNPNANTIAIRNDSGNLTTSYPLTQTSAVNVEYLDAKKYALAPSDYATGLGKVPYWFKTESGTISSSYANIAGSGTDTSGVGSPIVRRTTSGDIVVPSNQTYSGTSNLVPSMRSVYNNTTPKMYNHHKVLEVHATSMDLVLHFQETTRSPDATNFTNNQGQLPTNNQLNAEIICTGFYLDGTNTYVINSMRYNASTGVLSLTGLGGSASLFSGAVYTFSRPLTINLTNYYNTVGAITVTDTVSNFDKTIR